MKWRGSQSLGIAKIVGTVLMLAGAPAAAFTAPMASARTQTTTATALSESLEDGDCSFGCSSCSDVNGCLQCKPGYYLVLIRDFMAHRGMCSLSCPAGYYPADRDAPPPSGWTPLIKRCLRCGIKNCEACYNRHYCLRCLAPYTSFRGQCHEVCPFGGVPHHNYMKDCWFTDCPTGPWSQWSDCKPAGGAPCFEVTDLTVVTGFQTRSRDVLHSKPTDGANCLVQVSEQQQCMPREGQCRSTVNSTLELLRATPMSLQRKGVTSAKREYKQHRRKRRPSVKPQPKCDDGAGTATAQACRAARHPLGDAARRRDASQPLRSADAATPAAEPARRESIHAPTPPPPHVWNTQTAAVAAVELKEASLPTAAADVLSSDYYGYYLKLAKQMLKEKPLLHSAG